MVSVLWGTARSVRVTMNSIIILRCFLIPHGPLFTNKRTAKASQEKGSSIAKNTDIKGSLPKRSITRTLDASPRGEGDPRFTVKMEKLRVRSIHLAGRITVRG